uniref:Alpha-2-macroglobulin bait region domain-containing protein n=1 Tax=Athene cunicularia TaxID=194338 RepID=A0A663LTB9_ATHCN
GHRAPLQAKPPVFAGAGTELHTPQSYRSHNHYMVVFPAVIHHSQEEKLCIHFSSLTEDVHLAATLQVSSQNHTLVTQDVEKPGTFQCITFQVSVPVAPDTVAFLHVLIHGGDNVLFEGHKKVLIKPQKNVILVETDKVLYKPGETGHVAARMLYYPFLYISSEISNCEP